MATDESDESFDDDFDDNSLQQLSPDSAGIRTTNYWRSNSDGLQSNESLESRQMISFDESTGNLTDDNLVITNLSCQDDMLSFRLEGTARDTSYSLRITEEVKSLSGHDILRSNGDGFTIDTSCRKDSVSSNEQIHESCSSRHSSYNHVLSEFIQPNCSVDSSTDTHTKNTIVNGINHQMSELLANEETNKKNGSREVDSTTQIPQASLDLQHCAEQLDNAIFSNKPCLDSAADSPCIIVESIESQTVPDELDTLYNTRQQELLSDCHDSDNLQKIFLPSQEELFVHMNHGTSCSSNSDNANENRLTCEDYRPTSTTYEENIVAHLGSDPLRSSPPNKLFMDATDRQPIEKQPQVSRSDIVDASDKICPDSSHPQHLLEPQKDVSDYRHRPDSHPPSSTDEILLDILQHSKEKPMSGKLDILDARLLHSNHFSQNMVVKEMVATAGNLSTDHISRCDSIPVVPQAEVEIFVEHIQPPDVSPHRLFQSTRTQTFIDSAPVDSSNIRRQGRELLWTVSEENIQDLTRHTIDRPPQIIRTTSISPRRSWIGRKKHIAPTIEMATTVKFEPLSSTNHKSSVVKIARVAEFDNRIMHLIVTGVVVLFSGFVVSIYVQSTCHFVTTSVFVGTNESEFKIHAGLWKYSPINSAFLGHSYCTPYGNKYSSDPPYFSRGVGVCSFLMGLFSLIVLWTYLLTVETTTFFWNLAVKVAALAGIMQIFTYLFFIEDFCRSNECTAGPGAMLSIIVIVSWLALAFMMRRNCPLPELKRGSEVAVESGSKGAYQPPAIHHIII